MIFRKAVLIIHGFAGGTYDLEFLANSLELQRGFDVYTFTLPGHDNVTGKVKHGAWILSAKEHIEMLINYGYKNIYVVGHSMGGVIATYVASLYKEVKKLVLVAPAFHFLIFKNDKMNVIESVKSVKEILKEYKFDGVMSRFLKLPSNALLEFLSLVKEYYKSPFNISIPILIIQGTKDSVVPMTSAEYVFNNSKSKFKNLLIVKDVNHDIFLSKRREEVSGKVISFLKKFPKNEIIKYEI